LTDPEARRAEDLARISHALDAAGEVARRYTPGQVEWETKSERGDPVTEADRAIDGLLRSLLPRPGEGWLSEESRDDRTRLDDRRVWVVDPLDGTREFVNAIPEWCVSVGLVEDGRPVAGGVFNPATGEKIVGAEGVGVTLGGRPVEPRPLRGLAGAVVLASRSEVARGEWDRFRDAPFKVRPCGSVAYKLGLVAAGLADATWTLVPKHEWDVAAGAALAVAAGLEVLHRDGSTPRFNRDEPKLPDLLVGPPALLRELREVWI
jgi:myo-inositol-1(or 4)-monophosphatase